MLSVLKASPFVFKLSRKKMRSAFNGIFQGLKVLVTGHTGFKGSWLAIWLAELGADVIGFSLEPSTHPNHFTTTGLASKMTHLVGDICDFKVFQNVLNTHQPELIFHLAAQAIVISSYHAPRETFDVNAMGTIHVLEAAKQCPSVQAIVIVTTDKCYENQEWIWGYREIDRLGGNDPYSASKAMAELAVASYRKSFFSQTGPAVATARAGNVIGGGDFADYRIVPDAMKALLQDETIIVRNPQGVRPWLHVLDPLSGYLWLAHHLLEYGKAFAQAWNFGPLEHQAVTVRSLIEKMITLWGKGEWTSVSQPQAKPEMNLLRLNWDKAANELGWYPTYGWEEALNQTVQWFKAFRLSLQDPDEIDMYSVGVDHIEEYTARAFEQGRVWTSGLESAVIT
jgi:CDP-glucose 4,6-dehydratase